MPAKIPQDVTREDKLVGPLTLKQFLFVLLGASIIFIAYQYYSMGYLFFIEFALISLLAGGISVALAFLKVNGRPFGLFAINLFKSWFVPKQRLWRKEPRELVEAIKVQATDIKDTKSEIAERRSGQTFQTQLEKLSNLLDTGGTMKPVDQDAVVTQVNNLDIARSPINEAGLDVEDILTDSD